MSGFDSSSENAMGRTVPDDQTHYMEATARLRRRVEALEEALQKTIEQLSMTAAYCETWDELSSPGPVAIGATKVKNEAEAVLNA